jgi:hypothetical protein
LAAAFGRAVDDDVGGAHQIFQRPAHRKSSLRHARLGLVRGSEQRNAAADGLRDAPVRCHVRDSGQFHVQLVLDRVGHPSADDPISHQSHPDARLLAHVFWPF